MKPGSGEAQRAAIVTGAGSGIGRATARMMAKDGVDVLAIGRTGKTLAETADGWPRIHPFVMDITSSEAPEAVTGEALRLFGRIDVLVNNAAVAEYAPLERVQREVAHAQFATNLWAPVFLVQEALDALTESRGTVVNVSTAGTLGRAWPNNSVYGASKVALDFLTRTWAVELAHRGIRVVGIAPGVTDTGIAERMNWTLERKSEFLEGMIPRIPLGRLAHVDEVAWWIARVAQPEAAYATGVVLPVDGGASIF